MSLWKRLQSLNLKCLKDSNMTKAKKSTPKIKTETVINEYYEIKCPHCGTNFQGGFNKRSIRILCSRCDKPIEIEWDKAIEVTHF